MTEYIWPLFGGALIGVAALTLMLANGKVAGVSGILGRCIEGAENQQAWRWLFLLGLALGPSLIVLTSSQSYFDIKPIEFLDSTWLYVVAGLIVGIGTNLSSGCTSGHGICGIGRFSVRSITSTMVFMLVAVTVASLRGVLNV